MAPERRRVGYVAQEGALFPHLSVADNVGFGLPRAERRSSAIIHRLLATVGLPSSFATRLPHELSGGEQQRIALARALAPGPRIVLLDEPFSSLDAALRNETRAAVADALAEAGATALLVTHDQAEALSLGRKVAVLRRGRMAQIAEPELLYRRPIDAELARFLGEANLLPGVAQGDKVDCALGRLRLAYGMPNGPVEVMIRPEQIRLVNQGSNTVEATVRTVTFYGPDGIVNLVLTGPTGIVVTARTAGHRKPQPGAVAQLAVDGEVVAFARRGAIEPAGDQPFAALDDRVASTEKLAEAV